MTTSNRIYNKNRKYKKNRKNRSGRGPCLFTIVKKNFIMGRRSCANVALAQIELFHISEIWQSVVSSSQSYWTDHKYFTAFGENPRRSSDIEITHRPNT